MSSCCGIAPSTGGCGRRSRLGDEAPPAPESRPPALAMLDEDELFDDDEELTG